VSGLFPDPPSESTRGKGQRKIDGGREVGGLEPGPPRFMTDRRHGIGEYYKVRIGKCAISELDPMVLTMSQHIKSINQSINHKSLCSIATSRLELLHNAV